MITRMNNSYFLFTLFFFVCANVEAYPRHLIQELFMQQTSELTCASAGHTQGCCTEGTSACSVRSGSNVCFCDESCYASNECCSDIEAVGCLANSCRTAGLTPPGCCLWNSNNNCRANGGCYCDIWCRFFGDCCGDVPRVPQCSEVSVLQEKPQTSYDDNKYEARSDLLLQRLLATLVKESQ